MAANEAQKEPSIEEMMAATKEPSIEEMMAATKPTESEAPSAPPANDSVLDMIAGGSRQIVKGAGGAMLEVPANYVTAISALLMQGKVDQAKSYLDNIGLWYDAAEKQTREFESKHPEFSIGTQMTGAMIPGAPAYKIATAGLKEGMTLAQRLGQAAVSGAAGTAAYQAGEIAARPSEMRKGLKEEAKEIATAGTAGLVLGPTITGGIELGVQAPKVLTSAPVLKTISVLLGPPSQVLKQYADEAAHIAKLPSINDVTEFFGKVRDRISKLSDDAALNVESAQQNIELLKQQISKASENAEAAVKTKLNKAEEELSLLQEDLKFNIATQAKPDFDVAREAQIESFKGNERARRQQFDIEQAEYRQSLKDPNMGPHVASVQNAMDELKGQIVDRSATARELIRDDVFFDRRNIIAAWNEQLKAMKIKGTEAAVSETAQKAISAIRQRIKALEELPERLTGQQLKEVIRQYDDDLNGTWLSHGQFGERYDNALKDVRISIDTELKGSNPEYTAAISGVSELQEILKKVKADVGMKAEPGKIESALRKAIENPRVYGILGSLQEKTSIPVLDVVKDAQSKRALKARPEPRFMPGQKPDPKSLPEYQTLQNLRALNEMTKAQNFERAVFASVQNTDDAKKIVDLRRQITMLSDPDYAQAEVNKAVQDLQLTEEQAKEMLVGLEKQREELGQMARNLINDTLRKPEDIVGKILRAADNPFEGATATKVIDTLTMLPQAQFDDLFNLLTLRNPNDARKFFRALRVDEAMNKARTAGSKGTLLYRSIAMGLGGGIGVGVGAAVGQNTMAVLGGIGALAGVVRDSYGGQVAKQYLRAAVRMQGIPNVSKVLNLAPGTVSAAFRNATLAQLSDMASSVDQKAIYTISEALKPAVERDIKQSKMSAVERAKALNELNSLGGISGEYVRKIMLESMPAQSVQPMSEAIPALEADKPDMLQRLSKRTAREGVRGLQGIVQGMREA